MKAYRYDTEIVRLMYDHVESVVWFPDPIRYEQSGLSAELIADLRVWNALHDEGLDHDLKWRSPDYRARIEHERPLLAKRLSDELGNAFEIEFEVRPWPPGASPRARCRSSSEPTNPVAAAVFTALANEARSHHAEREHAMSDAPDVGFGWFAVSPEHGHAFDPLDTE